MEPNIRYKAVPIPILNRPSLKPKIRRTRSGCIPCKERKLKCDENRPACFRCGLKGRNCEYLSRGSGNCQRREELDNCPASSSQNELQRENSYSHIARPIHSIKGDGMDEFLLRIFSDRVCSSAFRSIIIGPENPYTRLFFDLSQVSAAVTHAMLAIACLYAQPAQEVEGPSAVAQRFHICRLRHQGRAIVLLNEDITRFGKANFDAVLASTLLLCHCEQSMGMGNTNYTRYLAGARTIIRQRFLNDHDSRNLKRHSLSTTFATRLLIKLFIWHDTMTIVTTPGMDYANDWDLNILQLTDLLNQEGDTNPHLFGCARDIFWLMSEVARFVKDFRALKYPDNDAIRTIRMLPLAMQIEKRLQQYRLGYHFFKLYTGNLNICEKVLSDCFSTVEIYRMSSLLYLYQIMPALSSPTMTDQLAWDILERVLAIPDNSPVTSYHGWPLIAVAEQSLGPHQRTKILQRLGSSGQKFYRGFCANNIIKLVQRTWEQTRFSNHQNPKTGTTDQHHWTEAIVEMGSDLAFV